MANEKSVKRAEELRKYIEAKGISKRGLERLLAITITHAEGLNTEDENSYKFIYLLATNPIELIDKMAETSAENGEVEIHGIH